MNTAIRLKLGKKIRQLREKHGMTQEELAESSGVDYKHVQLLESKNPSSARIDTIEKIAKAFGITSSELLKF